MRHVCGLCADEDDTFDCPIASEDAFDPTETDSCVRAMIEASQDMDEYGMFDDDDWEDDE